MPIETITTGIGLLGALPVAFYTDLQTGQPVCSLTAIKQGDHTHMSQINQQEATALALERSSAMPKSQPRRRSRSYVRVTTEEFATGNMAERALVDVSRELFLLLGADEEQRNMA